MRKVIKDTNMVPVTITDLTLESNIAEGKTNPPTTDAVAKAIAGGGGGGAEYVDLDALNTRFSSFEALSTEISNGASFIFYKTGSSGNTQYFAPSILKSDMLSCYGSVLGRSGTMVTMGMIKLDIYTSSSSLRYLISSSTTYNFDPSNYISHTSIYIPVGPHTAGELLVCSNGFGYYHLYKCILDYTQVGASSIPEGDSTHWALTSLGAELRTAVPVPTTADAGKILAVNSSGLSYWATPEELGLSTGEFG